jgi:D-tyrosyl-tRNA(Tyr) deacylase
MNLSAEDVGAEFLVVSQFTLYADLSRGRRPSFVGAAPPAVAEPLVQRFADLLRARGFRVATGRFGAHMVVEIHNDGPVTFALATDGWA